MSTPRYFGDLVSKSHWWPRANRCLFAKETVLSSSVQKKAQVPYLHVNRGENQSSEVNIFICLLKTSSYSEILRSRGWQTIAHRPNPAQCLPSQVVSLQGTCTRTHTHLSQRAFMKLHVNRKYYKTAHLHTKLVEFPRAINSTLWRFAVLPGRNYLHLYGIKILKFTCNFTKSQAWNQQ